jgi:plasmid stabilization system protein ParE
VNYSIIITPAAELDLSESRDWYEAIRPGLSKDFELSLDAALSQISRHPEAHASVGDGLRRTLMQRFPHAVFYCLRPDVIQVVAVIHTSRDPHNWQYRQH